LHIHEEEPTIAAPERHNAVVIGAEQLTSDAYLNRAVTLANV
jgi:hypothetical protein